MGVQFGSGVSGGKEGMRNLETTANGMRRKMWGHGYQGSPGIAPHLVGRTSRMWSAEAQPGNTGPWPRAFAAFNGLMFLHQLPEAAPNPAWWVRGEMGPRERWQPVPAWAARGIPNQKPLDGPYRRAKDATRLQSLMGALSNSVDAIRASRGARG